jgi:hypothetical protein
VSWTRRTVNLQDPLVDAFWFIGIYDENQFIVENSIDRYSIATGPPDY